MHFVSLFLQPIEESPNAVPFAVALGILFSPFKQILFANRQFPPRFGEAYSTPQAGVLKLPLAVSVHLAGKSLDGAFAKGNVLVGYHQLGINFDNPAKALALGASANRRIERKSRWSRGTEFPSVNGRAETFVKILEQVALEISCLGLSMSIAYGHGNSFGKPALRTFVGHQPITDHEDRIAFPPCLHQVFDPVKSLVFKRADMPAFGKKQKELGGLQSSRTLCKKAKDDMVACKFGNNRFGLCIRGFKANGFAAGRVNQPGRLGKPHLEVIADFSHRPHGRA